MVYSVEVRRAPTERLPQRCSGRRQQSGPLGASRRECQSGVIPGTEMLNLHDGTHVA